MRCACWISCRGRRCWTCCGAGRHCVEFAKAGHRVTGADLTERFLERARERATRQGVGVEFVRADMREFRRPGAFDAVTNLWTSFGYFDDPADDARVLENFFASLRPGGRLLMDMMGREPLVRLFRPREWRYDNDDRICIEERKVNDDWTSIENRWIMLDGEVRREATFRLRVFGAAELRALAMQAGFVDVRILGSLAGGPYDHKAERLVLLARRP